MTDHTAVPGAGAAPSAERTAGPPHTAGPPRDRPAGRSGPREGGRRGPDRGPRRGGPGGRRFFRRVKVCKFCKENIDHIDYKDVKVIGQFIGDRGKFLPRRVTGVCAPHQRQLKVAIKRARNIALLPYAARV